MAHLFILAMLLSKIAFIKKDPGALPELALDRTESVLLYKYYMIRVAEDARTSHGKHSSLPRAARIRVNEEAAMIGDPDSLLALIKLDWFQESCENLQSKMLLWAQKL